MDAPHLATHQSPYNLIELTVTQPFLLTPMKKILLLAVTLVAAAPAMADLALATSKNCMACHTVDKKVLGPAFKDIAAKYKDDKTAADKLAVKIIKGSTGVWGSLAMPANPQVNEAEAARLAAWVLSAK